MKDPLYLGNQTIIANGGTIKTEAGTTIVSVSSAGAPTVTGTTISTTGTVTGKSGTSVPATAGAVAAGPAVTLYSGGPSIYVTSDAPTFTAVKGSLCINTEGSSTSTRLYVNTNGSTTWTNVTTAA